MQITKGPIKSAIKVCIYGVEGIGKSTFASKFPNPVFIDTEGSTKNMDVARFPRPSSWNMLLDQIRYIKNSPVEYSTLVIDTADWAEQLCIEDICAKSKPPKSGIEDFGYGKGYVYLAEEFGRFLNLLEEIIEKGINVVITAHAKIRKFELPDETGAYDRWEMKLGKNTSPLLKEWADIVLMANYKTYIVNVDNQGSEKGKNKAQGGKRVMYTTHHPCWDAKNRHGLAPELDFNYSEIAHIVTQDVSETIPAAVKTKPDPIPSEPIHVTETIPETDLPPNTSKNENELPKALYNLMEANNVFEFEIQEAVAKKGYYPADTPIKNYDPKFISGVLVGAWPQVFAMIMAARENDLPFIA